MPLRPVFRASALCLTLWFSATAGHAQQTPASISTAPAVASQAARAVFDSYWQWQMDTFPEFATFHGDHRQGDRLTDESPEAEARRYAYFRQLQAQLEALPAEGLGPQDRMSVELLRHVVKDQLGLEGFPGLRSMTVNASPFPFQTSFFGLLSSAPIATEEQARQLLARMAAYPQRMAQEIAKLRRGMALGWVPPRPVLQVVLAQLDGQLGASGERSVYFTTAFNRLGRDLPGPTRDQLRAEGVTAVDTHVLPSIRRLRDFVAGEYMAAARDVVGLASYPDGRAAYAAVARQHTTTDLSPDEVHAIGLEQVTRLKREMDGIRREVGFDGDMAAFVQHLNTDPRFFHPTREAFMEGYRDIVKRIEPELPRLFADLPRAKLQVRSRPDFLGPGVAETYTAPAADGTRPGWFNVIGIAFRTRPTWGMEVLTAHEGAPGHHLQRALEVEAAGVPAFRRTLYIAAFNEGWALYAETLGPQLGLYRDPYSRFGALQFQAWRAARLVVDTGLHAKGWSRQQSIDYLRDASAFEPVRVASEVDRYISWPGQALSYMVGQLKIQELRTRAERALGPRFDIRMFHRAVLGEGQLPLDVLERRVNEWIATEGGK